MKDRLLELIEGISRTRLLVFGDLILDQFLFGEISRISREAPVLILKYRETAIAAGGAANAANNAAALGSSVTTVGVLGADNWGKQLAGLLPPGAETVTEDSYSTPTKIRILGGSSHSPRQQIVRLDYESAVRQSTQLEQRLSHLIESVVENVNGAVISDYGGGTVAPHLVETIVKSCGARKIPVVVDSRFSLLRYSGATAMTPNISEVEDALHEKIAHDESRIEAVGRELRRKCDLQALLITHGRFGMTLIDNQERATHIPIFGSDEVADVTGAGDTVIAAFTSALAAGATFFEAAMLANYAAGLVVMKRGIATVTPEELTKAVAADE
ncbi:MAG TPA: PfkB family carbohydrate kinase [Acidobacteriota bacterium]